MKHIVLTAFLLSFCYGGMAQHCENYDRSLFGDFLPKDFPGQINCVDSLGQKQGAWIYYKLLYSAKCIPGERAIGFYVDDYSFGYYANNKPIGQWENVYMGDPHFSRINKLTEYRYSNDTIFITRLQPNFPDQIISSLYIIGDSARYILSEPEKNAPIIIDCDKIGVCILRYKGEVLNFFTRKDLWAVFDKPYLWYDAKIKVVDKAEGSK